jgi:hypothetical protein
MSVAQRVSAYLGIFASIGLFVVVALVSPNEGVHPDSLMQGIGLLAIMAAAPIGALASKGSTSSVAALGGGMSIAGFATTPGGNGIGLVMAVVGTALPFADVSDRFQVTWRIFGSTLMYGIELAIGMYAALASGFGTTISLILAIIVIASSRWIPGRPVTA